jgi:hypothetical protein
MSYYQGMQKGNLDSVKADEHGKIKKETVDLKGVSVTRVTFDVGAKWSADLKGYAGTNSCQLPHVALCCPGLFASSWTMVRNRTFQKTMLCCCRPVMMPGP